MVFGGHRFEQPLLTEYVPVVLVNPQTAVFNPNPLHTHKNAARENL